MAGTTLRAAVYGRESQANTKSIDDQVDLGVEIVSEHGWALSGTYDDGSSASRYARKERPKWKRLLIDLDDGCFDVLVLWEVSRGDRRLAQWATTLDTCRDSGVLIHVINDDRTYDPRRSADYAALATAGVDAARESDKLSERSQRGVNRAVKKGRPPMGKTPYGYKRMYDPDTGDLVGQEPDPQTAPVVRSAFERFAAGESLSEIGRDLKWSTRLLHHRLRNPAYVGRRIHRRQGRNGDGRGEVFDGSWDGVVGDELFADVQARLDANARNQARSVRLRHLLSRIAVCGVCGDGLSARAAGRKPHYCCMSKGHVQVNEAELDALVTAAVLKYLSSESLYTQLRQAHEVSNVEVRRARDDVARLKQRLDDYRLRMRRGAMDPDDFAAISAGLREDIAAAQSRARRAALPPALRQFAEPGIDVRARWNDSTLIAKREVVRELVRVTVNRVGRGRGRRGMPVAERVSIEPTWVDAAD